MTTATQTGPRLAITGTCEGCAWLRRDAAVWRCAYPSILEARKPAIGGVSREPATPGGCPELPAARLALARSVVAEADRAQAEADRADIKRRMRMMPAEVMDDARAHGAGESEEQKR